MDGVRGKGRKNCGREGQPGGQGGWEDRNKEVESKRKEIKRQQFFRRDAD